MNNSAESVQVLVESELSRLRDQRVVAHIRSLLVTPQPQLRAWDYGKTVYAYELFSLRGMAEAYGRTGFGQ